MLLQKEGFVILSPSHMLMIRLTRVGTKNEAHFRLVLTDSKNAAKSGKFIEVLGSYNPKAGKTQFEIEKITERISKGAQLSDTARQLLKKAGHSFSTTKIDTKKAKKKTAKKSAKKVAKK
jgi:small subunit ribosomal protein S16